MAHCSEDTKRLEIKSTRIDGIRQLDCNFIDCASLPAIYLFWLPARRTEVDAEMSAEAFESLANFCTLLDDDSAVCVLTTPPDAARLLPYLQQALKLQLWVALKHSPGVYEMEQGALPKRHAALLILSRYRGMLRHTKTRIKYTYCPACGKTTKDYGGKKHVYHEYGTLISDVWRDLECDPCKDIDALVDRLADLFGMEPYTSLHLIDLHSCPELIPGSEPMAGKVPLLPLQPCEIAISPGLINGDCLEVLRTLPDNSLDFCFADPPYNLKKRYDHCNDSQEIIDYFRWCDLWLAELVRVLKPGRTLAVVNIPLWSVRHYQYLSSLLSFQCWIAWEALGFPVRMIMPSHYAILCFSKGEPRSLPGLSISYINDQEDLRPLADGFCVRASCMSQRHRRKINDREEISDLWHDIHRLKHNSRRVDHPCQLPPKLMRRLFALFTKPGEMVLDCFNGAGTSTLVAEQMGRKYMGIEISPEYHEIALQRHEMLKRGDDPFGKCSSVPKAKNSPVERLPKQRYRVTKKALQLEVKRIADQMGRIPNREDVMALSKYPLEYYDSYFLSWGEVCAAARTTGMSELPIERKNRALNDTGK
ncbi:MAG: site-specific DNA-methyltransferase [Methanothrix sp.]|nr:site-specific DNA-methyltransferase [Methanothrix sp.]